MKKGFLGIFLLIFVFIFSGCGIKKINDPLTADEFAKKMTDYGYTVEKTESDDYVSVNAFLYTDAAEDDETVLDETTSDETVADEATEDASEEDSEYTGDVIKFTYVYYNSTDDAEAAYDYMYSIFTADESYGATEDTLSDGKSAKVTISDDTYICSIRKNTVIVGVASTEDDCSKMESVFDKLKY